MLVPITQRRKNSRLAVLALLSFLLLILILPPVQAQVKLSDRKSEAYKESRKNRKNKRKDRAKRYREADKRNLSVGEMEVTPEVLKERYNPRDQNAESNPSKQIYTSYQKQSRIFTRKAKQSLDQGMISSKRLKTRSRNYRKQQRTIARHQGNIRIDPSRMGDNRGMFPQPPTEQNPGRSNIRVRNKKLSQYALKAEEMSMQGLVSAPSRTRNDRRNLRQSKKIGFDQGNLSINKRQQEAKYMGKSVEGLNQGMQKRVSQRGMKQQIMANSLTQSQFQGQVVRSIKQRDQGYSEKSIRNQKAGMKYKMRPGQKDANYMAKSVEGLNQGMQKHVGQKGLKQQIMGNSLTQSQFQGNIPAGSRKETESRIIQKSLRNQRVGREYKLNPREKENAYMAKSVEALGQGMMIRKSRNHEESRYIRKSKQAQDQGMISGRTVREKENTYMAKSVEALGQGMMIRKSRNNEESKFIRKSKQALDQGMISGKSVRQKEAQYMAKSVEGLNQGLRKSVTMREQKQQWMSNSLVQSQYQGNIPVGSKKEREGRMIGKSIRNQQVGLDYRYKPREKENNYMAKSVEGLNQGLTIRRNRNETESQFIRKSKEAQEQGMITARNRKQQEANYMGKSVEMLSQGLTIKKSRRDVESQYIRKSIEALNTGLVSTMNRRQKESMYMGKSVELLNQGMFRARSQQDKESMYIRKSIEASMTGLFRAETKKERDLRYAQQSLKLQKQGLYRTTTRKERELDLIKRSLRNQEIGLVKVESQRAREKEYRNVSREVHLFSGNFRVKSRLFEKVEYRRMAARRSKFDGMDRESRFEQWWASLWKKPLDQRKKAEPLRKPRYDSKEHEIWFY